MLKIFDIKTEYSVNPINVFTRHPRFLWKTSGERQTGYRIVAADSVDALNNADYNVYDSKKINSCELSAVYNGRPLVSDEKIYFKVIAYGENSSCESEICSFATALFEKSDWKGNWMSMPVNHQGGTSLYRKIIQVGGDIARATAFVCGIGYHEFFVNGKKVGDAVLNPGVTDYSKRALYCAYDVTDMLSSGDNVIGVEVGHGWLGSKRVFIQLNIHYKNGEMQEYHSSTNGGWWVSGSPVTDNSIYGGETYDARIEEKVPVYWASLDFEPTWENGWMFTVFAPEISGSLEAQTINPIRVCSYYNNVKKTVISDTVELYDIGANIAGWVRVKVKGEQGASVTIKYGERLDNNGRLNRLNLRSAGATDVYILKGEGEETYAPRFTYHGFQFVEIEKHGKCEILSVSGEHVHNDTKVVGNFSCSDETLNYMHEIALRTEHNNQHSILTDCPQRDERFGWLNDLGSRLYQTVYNCDMSLFFPKFTLDIRDTQLSGGEIGDTAPFYTGGRPADPVSIAYLLMPYYSYMYYGDDESACERIDGLKKWVDFLLLKSENGIMTYSYYADWVNPVCFDCHTDNLFVSTAYLFWHLKIMSKILDIVKDRYSKDYKSLIEYYSAKAEYVKKAIIEKYYDNKTYNFASGTQTENSLALSIGFAPECDREKIAANVIENVKKYGKHSTCGNVGYRHLFYVLGEFGATDLALEMLKNPEYPGWGYMVKNGATSVWERWESEMSNEMDSFDHPMFGSYDAFLYAFLGGIRVDDDACGANKITIKPVIASDIFFVKCSFETVKGKIVSDWKKQDGKVNYHIEVPCGTTATVVLGDKKLSLGEGSYDFIE